jgi:hypothetical protein
MNRESLLKRLVDRKMAASTRDRVFCVCFAGKPADGQRAASSTPRS